MKTTHFNQTRDRVGQMKEFSRFSRNHPARAPKRGDFTIPSPSGARLCGGAFLAAWLALGLPATAQAALSQTFAALFNNAPGAAAKMVTADDVRTYVTQRLNPTDRALITGLLNQHFPGSAAIRLRINAGLAVTHMDTVHGLVTGGNTQIQGPVQGAAFNPWGNVVDDRRDTFIAILKAINLIEQAAPIVEPQPERPRDGGSQNFSVEFLTKHAANNDAAAIEVARQRFNAQVPFNGQPPAPISQNLDTAEFAGFRTFINTLVSGNFFGRVEAHLQGQRNAFIGQLESIESVQYITPGNYGVRTYTPGAPPAPGGAIPAVRANPAQQQQRVQFAMTHCTQPPTQQNQSGLIVNHFITPLNATTNNPAPAPGNLAWQALPFNQIPNMPNAFNNAQNRPTIHYETRSLALRNDL